MAPISRASYDAFFINYINPLNIKDAIWLDGTQTSAAQISVGSHNDMIEAIGRLISESS
jgi:hypothetical protein